MRVLVLAVLGVNCSFDLVEVEAGFRSSRLELAIESAGDGLVTGTVAFDPGLLEDGKAVPVTDSRLVWGRDTIPPLYSEGNRAFRFEFPPTAASSLEIPIEIRAPIVRRSVEIAVTGHVQPLAFNGSDTLIVGPQAPATVTIQGHPDEGLVASEFPDLNPEPPVTGFWTATILEGGAVVLILSSPSPPRLSIQLPVELLPSDFRIGELRLEASMQSHYGSEALKYEVQVRRRSHASFVLVREGYE